MGGESGREWRHVCVWLSHFAVRRKPSQHCNQLRVRTLSHVQLFATPWTVTRQAPLSMEFSRQECHVLWLGHFAGHLKPSQYFQLAIFQYKIKS